MRSLTRAFIGLVIVGIIGTAAFVVFSFGVATRSSRQIEGTVEVVGLVGETSIYRNEYGIPHIVAQSDMDAFFAMGYTHAQDRLWQMELTRRVGRGRLSEVFGRRTLDYDLFLRGIDVAGAAKQLAKRINPDARTALEAYANGVNAFVQENSNRLPFEFDALGLQPEVWTVEDCLIVERLWAWEYNLSFWSDAAFGALSETLGAERAAELVPDALRGLGGQLPSQPYVMDSLAPNRKSSVLVQASLQNAVSTTATISTMISTTPTTSTRATRATSPTSPTSPTRASIFAPSPKKRAAFAHVRQRSTPEAARETVRETARLLSGVLQMGIELRQFLGQTGTAVGSNSWAVRATMLDSAAKPVLNPFKGAILANDAHLTLLMPPRWYEAHLTTPSMNVVGLTLPGLPFVIAGRNDHIAWGITNGMLDDCDFFIEKIDSSDSKRYVLPSGASKPFRIVTDTLRLRDTSVLGGVKDTLIDIRHTEHSAVISDVHLFRLPRRWLGDSNASEGASGRAAASALFAKHCVTFEWAGRHTVQSKIAADSLSTTQNDNPFNDEMLALYRLQKANSFERFLRAVGGFAVPSLNFVYADKLNNVGVAPCGSVPIRLAANDVSANFPRNAWQPEQLWQGFRTPAEFPRLYNPLRGYVVSANNPLTRSLPFFASSLYEPAARAARIEDLMAERATYSAFEAKIMQLDVVSPYAQALTPFVIRAVAESASTLTETEQQAFKLLQRWDGSMDKRSAQAALFNVFLERYVRNTLHDELGEMLFRQYCFITNIPTRKILELTLLDSVPNQQITAFWFDDKRTAAVEGRNEIIRRSFQEAIRFLQDRFASGSTSGNASGNPSEWRYGAIHQVTIPHVFGEREELKTSVNLGPYPVGGNSTTINSAEWKFGEPFKPVAGASMRFVCDMSDSVAYMIVPGGNGGQAITPNYSDQIQLWLGGGFVAVPVARKPNAAWSKQLVLKPKT